MVDRLVPIMGNRIVLFVPLFRMPEMLTSGLAFFRSTTISIIGPVSKSGCFQSTLNSCESILLTWGMIKSCKEFNRLYVRRHLASCARTPRSMVDANWRQPHKDIYTPSPPASEYSYRLPGHLWYFFTPISKYS